MPSIEFNTIEEYFLLQKSFSSILFISDDLTKFTEVSADSRIANILKLSNAGDISLLQNAAKAQLSPSTEAGSSFETFLMTETGMTRVCFGVLPTTYSRHNTPSRAHYVTQIVKDRKGSGDLTVVLLPSNHDYLFAQACAVVRPFFEYSGKQKPLKHVNIDIIMENSKVEINNISFVADGIKLCQRLIDTPPNILHTDAYVEECVRVATELKCQIEIIQGQELDSRGFGGIWGVGKASEHLPALVILSHTNRDVSEKSVCLVGKGIVYDTGGLSIKDKLGMPGMKDDMGGSAAVLGAFQAIVRSNIHMNVHALLCIAENSVGPLATRPDDIHVMYSGKTVEINNTDAEGRLVLSDGCNYASRHLNPSVIIDIATLTGAQPMSTGQRHAALYCNDEELEIITLNAGKKSGDLTFPLPYCPEFFKKEFFSHVADMKNSVRNRSNAQSACAGQFIGNHIEVQTLLLSSIITVITLIRLFFSYRISLLKEENGATSIWLDQLLSMNVPLVTELPFSTPLLIRWLRSITVPAIPRVHKLHRTKSKSTLQ
jgi:probable aminopeptidase NPEPL1